MTDKQSPGTKELASALIEQFRRERDTHAMRLHQLDRAIASIEEALVGLWDATGTVDGSADLHGADMVSDLLFTDQSQNASEPTPRSLTWKKARRTPGIHSVQDATGWARRLRGLTQPDALIAIAKHHGGEIRATEARDIIVATRLAKGKPENVIGHIHHMLAGSERFERLGPGHYRLANPSDGGTNERAANIGDPHHTDQPSMPELEPDRARDDEDRDVD